MPAPCLSDATLIANMRSDRRVPDGALQFVLARGIGETYATADALQAEIEALRWSEHPEP